MRLKKAVITCAASLALLLGAGSGFAQSDDTISMPDGQVMVPSSAVPSTETNDVEESGITQDMLKEEAASRSPKMTQEEKKRNAEENDSWGGGITIIAMCVVIGVLAILSVLFFLFGKVSAHFLSKKKLASHGITKEEAQDHHTEMDSGETIAAISLALHDHFYSRTHDLEDTILTIKRMRRNYSPWNSKIYNLRQVPGVQRNQRR